MLPVLQCQNWMFQQDNFALQHIQTTSVQELPKMFFFFNLVLLTINNITIYICLCASNVTKSFGNKTKKKKKKNSILKILIQFAIFYAN